MSDAAGRRCGRARLTRIVVLVGIPTVFLWFRILRGDPVDLFNMPTVDPLLLIPSLFFLMLAVLLVGQFVFSGKSPHTVIRPEQIDVTARRRRRHRRRQGRGRPLAAACSSSHQTSPARWAGDRAAACCSRAAPAPARPTPPRRWPPRPASRSCSPRRPRSSRSFQGATARKVRQYFKALRKAARKHGGAVGFIDEFDAIGLARSGTSAMTAAPAPPGCRCRLRWPERPADAHLGERDGRDAVRRAAAATCRWRSTSCWCRCSPSRSRRRPRSWSGKLVDALNLLLPENRQIRGPKGQARQHPAHRLDQPRRLAGPGAAAARSVRPAAHLRAAAQVEPPAADRPLPVAARRTPRSSTPRSAATRWPPSPRATARRCWRG